MVKILMKTLPNKSFCSVCGSEDQILIQEMPNGCEYSHLGGCICLYCCKECPFFDGCSEIQVRLGTILKKNHGKNKGFITFFGRI